MEPWDMWRHQSPSLSGGVFGAIGFMVVPELSGTGSESGATGTHDNIGALSCRVQSLALWD
jgi:hypothetical protein